jgi:hypothetical protein
VRTASAEEDVAPRVRPEDPAVLHDPLSAALAHDQGCADEPGGRDGEFDRRGSDVVGS